MLATIRKLLQRHEAHVDPLSNLKGGAGAVVGILLIGWLSTLTELPLLLAPLGATSVLLFGQPSSPLAQPLNVLGGYLVGTATCEAAFGLLPGWWVAAAVAVGVSIVIMRALRLTHPPAGAMPILGFNGHLHGAKLFGVIALASVVLIAMAWAIHRIPPRRVYPLPPRAPEPAARR